MKKRTLVGAIVALLALLAGVALGQELRVEYEGELIDGNARPLGGVFALRFKLYRNVDDRDAFWEEQHYVAAEDGEYTVLLGSSTPIDPALADQEVHVAVEFLGEELLREPLVLQRESAEGDPDPLGLSGLVADSEGRLTQVTFAQLADRAIVSDNAEHARNCDLLGGRPPEDFDRYAELERRILELEERLERASDRGGARVGSSTTVLQRVGGEGGVRYTRMCPAGYVVVGTRGGGGTVVDSYEVVCAPIE